MRYGKTVLTTLIAMELGPCYSIRIFALRACESMIAQCVKSACAAAAAGNGGDCGIDALGLVLLPRSS